MRVLRNSDGSRWQARAIRPDRLHQRVEGGLVRGERGDPALWHNHFCRRFSPSEILNGRSTTMEEKKEATSGTVTGNDQHVGFRAMIMKQAIEYNLAGF